jgi:hypothetical protein
MTPNTRATQSGGSSAPWHPGRLWSLWDMQKIFGENYIRLGTQLQQLRLGFHVIDTIVGGVANQREHEKWDHESDCKQCLKSMIKTCEELGLAGSQDLVSQAYDDLPQTQREFDLLVRAVMAEVNKTFFLYIPSHLAKYYEWAGIVSDSVIDAFPKASQEIRTGGTCLATGLHTACVFHGMRAAEIGLRALGNKHQITIKSGKPLELAEWREILDGLSGAALALENLPNSTPHKEADLHFLSEAAAQFRFFKSGWRIRVAHGRATYIESEAIEAINHVRSFFETLATRLMEPI